MLYSYIVAIVSLMAEISLSRWYWVNSYPGCPGRPKLSCLFLLRARNKNELSAIFLVLCIWKPRLCLISSLRLTIYLHFLYKGGFTLLTLFKHERKQDEFVEDTTLDFWVPDEWIHECWLLVHSFTNHSEEAHSKMITWVVMIWGIHSKIVQALNAGMVSI